MYALKQFSPEAQDFIKCVTTFNIQPDEDNGGQQYFQLNYFEYPDDYESYLQYAFDILKDELLDMLQEIATETKRKLFIKQLHDHINSVEEMSSFLEMRNWLNINTEKPHMELMFENFDTIGVRINWRSEVISRNAKVELIKEKYGDIKIYNRHKIHCLYKLNFQYYSLVKDLINQQYNFIYNEPHDTNDLNIKYDTSDIYLINWLGSVEDIAELIARLQICGYIESVNEGRKSANLLSQVFNYWDISDPKTKEGAIQKLAKLLHPIKSENINTETFPDIFNSNKEMFFAGILKNPKPKEYKKYPDDYYGFKWLGTSRQISGLFYILSKERWIKPLPDHNRKETVEEVIKTVFYRKSLHEEFEKSTFDSQSDIDPFEGIRANSSTSNA